MKESQKIWRLVAHHATAAEAVKIFKQRGTLAIGWNELGSLEGYKTQDSISAGIKKYHSNLKSAQTGAPSLFRFANDISIGDLVIVRVHNRADSVFEVTGGYKFVSVDKAIEGYQHQIEAKLTDMKPKDLWQRTQMKPGNNPRWSFNERVLV